MCEPTGEPRKDDHDRQFVALYERGPDGAIAREVRAAERGNLFGTLWWAWPPFSSSAQPDDVIRAFGQR